MAAISETQHLISEELPSSQPALVAVIIKNMDKHLAIPLLQFVIENPSNPALVAQYRAALKSVANKTNRFDLRRQLVDEKSETKAAELETIANSEELAKKTTAASAKAAQCLVQEFLQVEEGCYTFRHSLKEMEDRSRQAKFSLLSLKRAYGATEKHIAELAMLAHHLYEMGRYKEAGTVLELHKRCVTPRYRRRDANVKDDEDEDGYGAYAEPDIRASWGRFACGILLNNRDMARDASVELLQRLDAYDSAAGQVLAQHVWFTHWNLCLLAMERGGTTDLLYLMYRDKKAAPFLRFRYQNTIMCLCPHLCPYLAAAAVLNRGNSQVVTRATRIIETDMHRLRDPLSRFLVALRVKCDFELASKVIEEAEAFMKKDYFLHRHAARYVENARMMVVQNKLWVHKVMSTEQTGEMQLVKLIRDANVDATIDSVSKTVTVHTLSQRTVWKQVLDSLAHVAA